ncbi:OmpA-OmpF porin, OOP family [Roseovarius nanhaiticus]|uniref:OmpA-OmpF porin, OOP family n=2 Tax=Roseovarius nanhaiticus TaxID=573024 RepID=A0A1N7HLJ3_9RHOB|nr:OmpA family protein [Roseovarius nanhaiticus]SEL27644.1 OmpA-OmpF porin, OOP family [Roseovarius nanhaiticus]SIS25631.1 OmpA-OmpF porin, OOP family [Roseovarius nanhaiticus]
MIGPSMRLSAIFAIVGTFALAAVLCLVAASFTVRVIEDNARHSVRSELDKEGMTWTEVDADGLQVFLAGSAPSEAKRFAALTVAGRIVDAARVIDQMLVEDSAEIAPPRFSVEILRNDHGISLIGLVPAAMDREAFTEQLATIADEAEVIDLLESADYPVAGSWDSAIDYALRALAQLPRAKISVDSGRVAIITMADSPEEKVALERDLRRRVPSNLRVSVNVSAPRPVITPFTLRFLIEDGEARFDACSADTPEAQRRILNAARQAGLEGDVDCIIGLGVPTPEWGEAAALAIAALSDLGGGSITFADADIALIAPQGTEEAKFDDVVGGLNSDLPDVFALKAVLPPPETEGAPVIPEFVATLSPEGLVQLRGKLGSQRLRDTVDSFAKARFRSDAIYNRTRMVEGLPGDWPVRVLTGLEALGFLAHGAVVVTPTQLSVTGKTGRKEAGAQIAGLLAEKLGEASQFDIDVEYQEALDPVAGLPTPEECIAQIEAIQGDRKINFEPGSATIDGNGAAIMNDIADILDTCGEIRIEIGGHTDSQGREEMNEELSQARANAVLDALRARRVLTSSFTAKGYGESTPIAGNDTEEGREANRRIEFKLIKAEPLPDPENSGLESLEEEGQEEEASGAGEEGSGDEQN